MRSIIIEPCSSYSYLLIHICWKEPHELSIDPPTHGVKRFSAPAMTLTRTFCGATSGTCFWRRSMNPRKQVLPPVIIMFWKRSRLMSISVLPIESTTIFCTPVNPSKSSWGVNIVSRTVTRSDPIAITVPSGSSHCCARIYCAAPSPCKGSSDTNKNSSLMSLTICI